MRILYSKSELYYRLHLWEVYFLVLDFNDAPLSWALQRAPSGQGKGRVDFILRRGLRKYAWLLDQYKFLTMYSAEKNISQVFPHRMLMRWAVLAAKLGTLPAVVDIQLVLILLETCSSSWNLGEQSNIKLD